MLFAVPGIALLLTAQYCASPLPRNTNAQESRAADAREGAPAAPQADADATSPFVKLLKALVQAQNGRRSADGTQGWWRGFVCDVKITDALLATFVFWLALASGALILAAHRQATWARRLYEAAVGGNSAAASTGEKELRAYLSIASGQLFFLSSSALRANIEIKNFGKTPARQVAPAIAGEIRDPGEQNPFGSAAAIPHKQPMAPAATWIIGHEFHALSPQQAEDVRTGRQSVFVWGHVAYEDIFGRQQLLTFRFRNTVREINAAGQTQRWHFYPEEEGNETT